jgi:glutathione S-transferase
MSTTGAYTIYGRPGSGSVAPQMLLEELGQAYSVVWVGKDEAAIQDYGRICPTRKVPALVLPDGTVMIESAAMLIHLTTVHGEKKLAPPPGTSEHARFLQWMVFLSANLYESALRAYYSARYSADGEADAPAIHKQAILDFDRHAGVMEAALSPFLLGAEASAADMYLYMLGTWYPPGTDALAAKFPKIGVLMKAVAARPAVAKVMAENS